MPLWFTKLKKTHTTMGKDSKVPGTSIALALDQRMRRISWKHVCQGVDTNYSLFVYALIISACFVLDNRVSLTTAVSLVSLSTISASYLYQRGGGSVYRRYATDQAQWVCKSVEGTATKVLSSLNSSGAIAMFIGITLLAEIAKFGTFWFWVGVFATGSMGYPILAKQILARQGGSS